MKTSRLYEALVDLNEVFDAASADIEEWLYHDFELEEALLLLERIRKFKARVAVLEAAAESHCAQGMPDKEFVSAKVRAVRSATSKTTWDDRHLAGEIVAAKCIDDAGEVDPDLIDHVWGVVDSLLGAAAVSYWRTGALKELGIDPDEFRQREWGRRTVRILPLTL